MTDIKKLCKKIYNRIERFHYDIDFKDIPEIYLPTGVCICYNKIFIIISKYTRVNIVLNLLDNIDENLIEFKIIPDWLDIKQLNINANLHPSERLYQDVHIINGEFVVEPTEYEFLFDIKNNLIKDFNKYPFHFRPFISAEYDEDGWVIFIEIKHDKDVDINSFVNKFKELMPDYDINCIRFKLFTI